ncbi:hypothetical protein EDD22DRAFT_908144 [Suillus occidentalis]|nr:hypothetical protein EDD22DRAFT_908144 [Suillus occidentalis]
MIHYNSGKILFDSSLLGELRFYQMSPQILSSRQHTLSSPSWTYEPCEFCDIQNPRHFGPITCMCLDRKRTWIPVVTSMGVLSLWDRRFGLLLKS